MQGSGFPFIPKPLNEVLAGPLIGADDQTTTMAQATAGKEYILLYFSASWCPPCQRFTPRLASMYTIMKEKGRSDFECIFVSADRDPQSFDGYRHKQPWLAIPFGDARLKAVNMHFEIEGIPSLIVLDKDFKVSLDASTPKCLMMNITHTHSNSITYQTHTPNKI